MSKEKKMSLDEFKGIMSGEEQYNKPKEPEQIEKQEAVAALKSNLPKMPVMPKKNKAVSVNKTLSLTPEQVEQRKLAKQKEEADRQLQNELRERDMKEKFERTKPQVVDLGNQDDPPARPSRFVSPTKRWEDRGVTNLYLIDVDTIGLSEETIEQIKQHGRPFYPKPKTSAPRDEQPRREGYRHTPNDRNVGGIRTPWRNNPRGRRP